MAGIIKELQKKVEDTNPNNPSGKKPSGGNTGGNGGTGGNTTPGGGTGTNPGGGNTPTSPTTPTENNPNPWGVPEHNGSEMGHGDYSGMPTW